MIITKYNHQIYYTDCTLYDHYQVQPSNILYWLYTWWSLLSTTIKYVYYTDCTNDDHYQVQSSNMYSILTVHFIIITTQYNKQIYYSDCTLHEHYLVQPWNILYFMNMKYVYNIYWLYNWWSLPSTTVKYTDCTILDHYQVQPLKGLCPIRVMSNFDFLNPGR